MCVSRVFLFFFFFQAEDGIRDHCVTGVQTCALPISLPRVARGKVFSLTARRATRTLVLSVSSRETTVATLPVCWAAKEAAREKGVRDGKGASVWRLDAWLQCGDRRQGRDRGDGQGRGARQDGAQDDVDST